MRAANEPRFLGKKRQSWGKALQKVFLDANYQRKLKVSEVSN